MMAAEECPHGADPDVCPPCQRAADQGHGAALPSAPERLRTFRARFDDSCAVCYGLILPDDEIAANPDEDTGGYLCAVCVEEHNP